MKNIIKNRLVLASLIGSAIMTSCSIDELTLSDPNNYSVDQITDIDSYIIGMYDTYQKIPANEYVLSEMRTDNTGSKSGDGNYGVIDQFTYDSSLADGLNYWGNNYTVIRQANLIINNINEVTDDQMGQAYFMRGLAHFNLAMMFANVPYLTEVVDTANEAASFPQLNQSQVLDLVIDDLTTATGLLSIADSADNIYASLGAAKALLAKVYLSKPNANLIDYTAAQDLLSDMIDEDNSYGYALLDDYASIFGESSDNSEVIFAIQYTADSAVATEDYESHSDADGEGDAQAWSDDMSRDGDAQGLNVATDDFITAVGDATTEPVRYDSLLYFDDGRYYNNKFRENIGNQSAVNWIVLRYADVLLMYTEAQILIDDSGDLTTDATALETYNRVLTRAGKTNVTQVTKDELLAERRIEFAYENQRYLDLHRFDVIDDVLSAFSAANGYSYNNFNKFLAIPQREIDANGSVLTQNIGY